uniref:C-type lectin domain-containing protein n=1 Tax=Oryzias latipes TaxID=8090 RepID=H2MGM7_ORYLA
MTLRPADTVDTLKLTWSSMIFCIISLSLMALFSWTISTFSVSWCGENIPVLPPSCYHHVKALKTWEEAQQACRQLYSDLATVASPAESTRLLGAVQEPGELAWIGLYDNMAKWKWTMGHPDFDSNIDYHNWQFDNPKYKGTKDTCGTIRYNGLWRDEICDTERPFVCYHGGLKME